MAARFQRGLLRDVSHLGIGVISSVIVGLVTVPLVITGLGTVSFGVWAVFSGLVVLISPFDFGIANALVQRASHRSSDTASHIGDLVGRALLGLCVVAGGVTAVLLLLSVVPGWAQIVNAPAHLSDQVQLAGLIVVVAIGIGFPAGLVDRLNLVTERAFVNGWLALAAAAVVLASMVAARACGAETLGWYVAATVLPAPLIRMGALVVLLGSEPRLRPLEFRDPVGIGRLAPTFIVLQGAAVIVLQIDPLLISRRLGVGAVASYSVPARAFTLLATVSGVMATALWPRFSEARTARDDAAVRRLLRRSLAVGAFGAAAAGCILVLAGPAAFSVWTGGEVVPSRTILALFGCLGFVYVLANVMTFALLGLGKVREQSVIAIVLVLVKVPSSVLLISLVGVDGAVWSSIAGYGLVVLFPLALLYRRAIRELVEERRSLGGAP